nr:hypothetical protein [Tanacetum cinerariifolium]
MRSIISMVSISLEGFLPPILLLVVIIVAVVIVAVILVVVVIDAIVRVVIVVAGIGVVVVVMIIGIVVIFNGGVSHIIKLSCMIIVTFPSMLWGSPLMKASIIFSLFGTMFGHKTANSWNLLTPGDPISLFYSDRLSVCIPPRQGIIDQACASRAATTPSVISYRMVASVIAGVADSSVVDLTGVEDLFDEDGGTRMGDSTGVLVSLGKKTSMSKGYLVKLLEELGDVLPEGIRSIISMVSISLEGFLPPILLLVVIIVAVVIVAVILVVIVIDAIVGVVNVVASIGVVVVFMIIGIVFIVDGGVSHIIKLLFVIIVTFPSMLWGSPLMKASIIFSVVGTMFGHKTANSWNLLTPGDPISLFYSDRLSVCIPPRQGIIDQ